MQPIALKCGISLFDYWNYTYGEIIDIIQVCQEQEKEKYKAQIANNYELALMIAAFINRANNGETPPELYEVYPSYFDKPKEESNEDWLILKEQMLDFAEEHNKKGGYNE